MDDKSSMTPLLHGYKDVEGAPEAGQPTEPSPAPHGCDPAARKRKRRRILFHFFTLLAVVSLVTFHSRRSSRRCHKGRLAGKGNWEMDHGDEDHDHGYIVPPGVVLEKCTTWDGNDVDAAFWPPPHRGPGHHEEPTTSSAAFTVPVDKKLFFLSTGSLASGSFKLTQAEDRTGNDVNTKVDITTYDNGDSKFHDHILGLVRVCTISKEHDESAAGVGIFTPRWRWRGGGDPHRHWRSPHFDVAVELPRALSSDLASSDPLSISSFTTHLPAFTHDVQLPADGVTFKNLALTSTNAHIDAASIVAQNLTILTSNGAIKGEFTTSDKLVLATSNAAIDATLSLYGSDSDKATTAFLSTNNGHIVAATSLLSGSEESGGKFNVTATTSNAKVGLTFPQAPVKSTLKLSAHTSNGGVDVSLHPTYEGSYLLTSSATQNLRVIADENEADPEGKGRKRIVNNKFVTKGFVNGETYWESKDEKEDYWGSALLTTSNAHVTLKFEGQEVSE
ncbi:hypothetical protein D9611_001209 [Ephemerocybe angulata]|uniref:Uncharacterized protein n=1 Tax=Ephemerocybe angulata TaxID=980116 RepID=A0A8H5FMD4_9AGAR|nr:hypothetical protein D9611_001209 [Tulosesus angulatus]